jgi:hypothetical protein
MRTFFPCFSFARSISACQAVKPTQGHGSRFFHGECFGLDRRVVFFNRNELRECTDSPVSRPRIDFVARLESTYARSDPDHDAGDVMAPQ